VTSTFTVSLICYTSLQNTGQEFDGSDSGARPDEAVSWGKIRADAEAVKVNECSSILTYPSLILTPLRSSLTPHWYSRCSWQLPLQRRIGNNVIRFTPAKIAMHEQIYQCLRKKTVLAHCMKFIIIGLLELKRHRVRIIISFSSAALQPIGLDHLATIGGLSMSHAWFGPSVRSPDPMTG